MCFRIDVQRFGVMFDISGAVLKFAEHIESTAVLRHVSFFLGWWWWWGVMFT